MSNAAKQMDEIFGRGQRVRAEVVSHHEDPAPRDKGRGILEQDSYTTVRFVSLTKQGVRDLNGPRMNGSGYNGSRSVSCPHHRDPQAVATFVEEKLSVDAAGFPKTVRTTKCASCGDTMGPGVLE